MSYTSAGGTESSHKETGSPQQGTSRMTEDREKVEKRLKGGESERSGRSSPQEKREGEGGEDGGEGGEKGEAPEAVLTEEDLIQQSQAEYDSGRYSPTLLQNSELPLDTHVTDVDEDMQRLHLARRQMQVTGEGLHITFAKVKITNHMLEVLLLSLHSYDLHLKGLC